MSTLPPDAERCSEEVWEQGRGAWHHRCHNRAKPGTTRCGVHTKRDPDELRSSQADASTPPDVSVQRTARVRLAWPAGEGPVMLRDGKLTQVDRVRFDVDLDRPKLPTYVTISGVQLNSKGARSQRDVSSSLVLIERVPGLDQQLQRLRDEGRW
jgi:hypothetical protein